MVKVYCSDYKHLWKTKSAFLKTVHKCIKNTQVMHESVLIKQATMFFFLFHNFFYCKYSFLIVLRIEVHYK